MRKILAVVIVLFTTPVFGQNHFIGMQGGISWTNVISEDCFFTDTKNRIGIMYGVTYDYTFKNKFHFGIDLIYAQKGFRNEVSITDQYEYQHDLEYESDYNYLSIPLKGGFLIGDNFSGFLYLGVVPSILMNAEALGQTIGSSPRTIDITDEVNEFDFGGLIELGASYKFKGRFMVFTSFAYQQSFMPTKEKYFSNGDAKHYGMTSSFGLRYALKKE